MIKADISGGIGNQLFEYAYARTLSLEYNEPIVFNFVTPLELIVGLCNGFEKGIFFYGNILKYFNITPCLVQNPVIGFLESIFPAIYVYWPKHRLEQDNEEKMRARFLRMTKKGKYYYADLTTSRYYPHCRTNKKIKHVHGMWQSEKYFIHYSEIIRKELRVIAPISEKNKYTMEEMQSCNSVAIHFRKGQNAIGSAPKGKAGKLFGVVCSNDYYKRGMRYIAEHILNPVFYIFSNDIPWIKNNVEFEYPVKYVDYNNPGYEDLRLMYSCKHFIIANSTLSWWGSYLSDNHDKIVVAPSYWITKYSHMHDIYRDDMVLINPDKE